MAIKPSQLETHAKVSEEADRIEQQIDAYLDTAAKQLAGQRRVTVHADPPKGPAILEELQKRYCSGEDGWASLTHESDRDGSHYILQSK